MDTQAFKKNYAEVAAMVVRPSHAATGGQLSQAVQKLERQASELTQLHQHQLVEHMPEGQQHALEECRRLEREIHNLATEASRLGVKAKLAQSDRKLLGQIVDSIGQTMSKVIDTDQNW
jgi:uncharacterized protein (UPF0335 family)